MVSAIKVVAAVIVQNDNILCVQRGSGQLVNQWEFPGGKVEREETLSQALKREITEELSCQINVGEKVTETIHEYSFGQIQLITFYCDILAGEPILKEHLDKKWLHPDELLILDWAEADIPTVQKVMKDFC